MAIYKIKFEIDLESEEYKEDIIREIVKNVIENSPQIKSIGKFLSETLRVWIDSYK